VRVRAVLSHTGSSILGTSTARPGSSQGVPVLRAGDGSMVALSGEYKVSIQAMTNVNFDNNGGFDIMV
jgi:hypothetical protein